MFSGISLTTAALTGPIVATIRAALRTHQADLLILCEQIDQQEQLSGIGGLAGQLFEHSHIPLLLIPEHGPSPLTARADRTRPITVLVAFDGPRPARVLIAPATSLLTALGGKCQEHLCFVLLSALGSNQETPSFGTQMAERPVASVGSDMGHTKTSAALLKDPKRCVSWEKVSQRDASDVLVLGMQAQSLVTILEESQRRFSIRGNTPVLLVPLPQRG